MAGLFDLFRKKNNQPQDSYFLNPDEAKTFGDIDYMRKSKTVKRTFAKSVSGGGGELVKEVSSMKMIKKDADKASANNSQFSTNTPESSFTPNTQQLRNTDTSMDAFRKMAKQIKK